MTKQAFSHYMRKMMSKAFVPEQTSLLYLKAKRTELVDFSGALHDGLTKLTRIEITILACSAAGAFTGHFLALEHYAPGIDLSVARPAGAHRHSGLG